MTLRFPAGIDAQRFLSDYWQRKPLRLTNALDDVLPRLTVTELTQLACSDEVESRLLRSAGPAEQWQLQHGPLRRQDFEQLPATGWTLLVQDVDKFVPEVAALLEQFSFIPAWRIDDVMISYATPGGTVGPHIDQYDVFLIQGDGTRTWQTGSSDGTYIADLPVRVLKDFDVGQSWQLKTGDALYLPPGVAHHGHSDIPCTTISVGFRAPSLQELVLSQAEYHADRVRGRYADPGLSLAEARDGLISTEAVERALALLQGPADTVADATVWFGRLVTENKPWLQPEPPDAAETPERFAERLHDGVRLQKYPGVRMAHSENPANGMLFVDGSAWPLSAGSRSWVRQLCRGDRVHFESADESVGLLYELYCDGKIYWPDDQ